MLVHWPLYHPIHASAFPQQTRRRRNENDSRVGIDTPRAPTPLERSNPLLSEGFIAGGTELPAVAGVAAGGRGGFDVEPEMVDDDAVGVDGSEEVVELGGDGFAGDAVGCTGAFLGGWFSFW